MTLTLFNKLHRNYKNTFDMEMRLKESHTTYAEAEVKANEEEEWLH